MTIGDSVKIVCTRYKGYKGKITFIERDRLKKYFVQIENWGKGTYFYESDLELIKPS